MTTETRYFEILVAEDRPEDEELVRMALREHDIPCKLHVIRDGEKVIGFIHDLESDPHAPALDLCLVDMHLPKRDGADILKCLRSIERYAQTPVVVMSGINAPSAEAAAAKYAAVSFFRKPSTLEGYLQLGSLVRDLLGKTLGAA